MEPKWTCCALIVLYITIISLGTLVWGSFVYLFWNEIVLSLSPTSKPISFNLSCLAGFILMMVLSALKPSVTTKKD